MTYVIKSVELPTQVTLPYIEQGDRSGVPVVLLHGLADSWRSFELVLPHIPESLHTFALTHRGHGDASRPATGYRFRDFAADLAAFMDAVYLETAVIVGHSLGSAIALRFAIDYPERMLGLVLVSCRASLRNRPGALELWNSTISRLADSMAPDFVRGYAALAQPVPSAYAEAMLQEGLKVPAFVWKAVYAGGLEEDLSTELSKITAPTLVVWGAQDASVRHSDQETLLAAIAGSRIVEYSRAGHMLHWEEPERFAADLTAFVNGLGQA